VRSQPSERTSRSAFPNLTHRALSVTSDDANCVEFRHARVKRPNFRTALVRDFNRRNLDSQS
jgi:hypothetical protein